MAAPELIFSEDRERWLAARRTLITATKIAGILGVHPYVTPRTVYLDMKGLLPEVEENEPMRWGNLLEPVVGAEWSRRNSKPIEKAPLIVHPRIKFFGATPDYFVGEDELLEVKTAGPWVAKEFGDEGSDHVPDQYLLQVQWQLYCTGRKMGHLAVLIAGQDFRTYRIKPDAELFRRMEFHGRKFHSEYIENECPPPITGQEADSKLLNHFHPKEDGSMVVASTDLEIVIADLGWKLQEIATAEIAVEKMKNQLKEFMGDADAMKSDEGLFTWRTQKGKVSWAKVAAKFDVATELIEEFTGKPSRTFRTPFTTGKA